MAFLSIPMLAGVLVAAVSFYKFLIYPIFLSPLSEIPNAHPTSRISPVWILWMRYTGWGNRTIQAAHEKHGPIVQVAPNEISINCVDGGIRTVYAGGFEKHQWYPNLFGAYGVLNMFSMMHTKPHSVRKRMLSNAYSKSYLQNSPHMDAVSKAVLFGRYLPIIERAAAAKSPIEIHLMNNALTMDFVSGYQYGLQNSTNLLENVEERKHIFHLYHCRKPYEFHRQEIPNLTAWCKCLGMPLIPKFVGTASAELQDWCMKMVMGADSYVSTHFRGEEIKPGDEPNIYRQLKLSMLKASSDAEKGATLDTPLSSTQQLEVAAEMYDHMTAGNETSGIALTYCFWELSQHPFLQMALRNELMRLENPVIYPVKAGQTITLPDPKDVDALPLLNAILMETLRLHAPIPGGQPRITPMTPAILAGYGNLPPNVRVNAQAYSLHRNADVFPEPGKWIPDRWLQTEDPKKAEEMKRWFWAFGSGGRMCIGSNLAMQEMKLTIAALYTNFTSTIVNDEGIEQDDAYTAQPRGFQLTLKFDHV